MHNDNEFDKKLEAWILEKRGLPLIDEEELLKINEAIKKYVQAIRDAGDDPKDYRFEILEDGRILSYIKPKEVLVAGLSFMEWFGVLSILGGAAYFIFKWWGF